MKAGMQTDHGKYVTVRANPHIQGTDGGDHSHVSQHSAAYHKRIHTYIYQQHKDHTASYNVHKAAILQ